MYINDFRIPTHLYEDAIKRASTLNTAFETYLRNLIKADIEKATALDKEITDGKYNRY